MSITIKIFRFKINLNFLKIRKDNLNYYVRIKKI